MPAPETRPPAAESTPPVLNRLWDAFTAPAPGLTAPADQRQARWLAALTLVTAPFLIYLAATAALFARPADLLIPAVLTGSGLLLAAAYGLSRTTRTLRGGLTLGLAVSAALPLALILLHGRPEEPQAWAWAVFGLLSVSLIAGPRWIGALTAIYLAGLSLNALGLPAVAIDRLAYALGFVGLTGVLLLLQRWGRDRQEREAEAELQRQAQRAQTAQHRLEARNRELERRSARLAAALEVGRALAVRLNPDRLLAQAIELIRERFDFSHVAVYLLDEAGARAVLHEAAGPRLQARGDALPVGPGSLVGQAAAQQRALLLANGRADLAPGGAALLPDARSAAAVPLRAEARLIGVLEVQSRDPLGLATEDLDGLQLLADQLAAALENGQLLARQQRLLQLEQLVRSLTVKLHQTVDVETILENTAAELGRALGARRAVVRLQPTAPAEPTVAGPTPPPPS